MVFRAVLMALLLGCLGCGARLANPRSHASTSPPPAAMGTPASEPRSETAEPAGIARVSAPDVPRVPVDTVLNVPASNVEATYHEVVGGQTLESIAPQYGLDAETLRRANGLDRNAVLQAGQLLYVPEPKAARMHLADE
ncbi:MAG: LysM peptidoglycan-binding domain-containing protein [Planctomycetaceae bacterium]|nr:LysM peptidoglycan-binding domain-containing protein [Planctomycetaceae bacterium]